MLLAFLAIPPVTAREDKRVRAVMRVLGLRYETVKHAIEIRKAMVDTAAGWKWINTKPHRDRMDWGRLKKWLHGDEASTPDNDHKVEIKVNVVDDGGTVSYELHERCYWNDKLEVLRARFRETSDFAAMQAAHREEELRKRRAKAIKLAKAELLRGHGEPAEEQIEAKLSGIVAEHKQRAAWRAARRRLRKLGSTRDPTPDEVSVERAAVPEVSELIIGRRQWREALCGCTFHRKGGECDCPQCTYTTHNTMRLRRDMINWHSGPNKKCELGCLEAPFVCPVEGCKEEYPSEQECDVHTGQTCTAGVSFRAALSDVHQLTKYLLCDRVEVPELTRKGAKKPFWTYNQRCLKSTCSAPVLNNRRCGWGDNAPRCPMLESTERHGWKRYENVQSGVNRETGEPFHRSEFVLHIGTVAGFMEEFTAQYKSWLPHYHRDRLIKNNKRLLNDHVQRTELEEPKTLQSVSDYASQPSLPREFTGTCQSKQRMNNCVMLLSFKPHEVSMLIQKRGKREERTVNGIRNECIVVYGLFDPDIKPSAQQYNMQRLDAEMYLKFGFTIHGEWFKDRKRIPRHKLRAPTDDDGTIDEPDSAAGRKGATLGKRVLIHFPDLNDHYGGIVDSYDGEKIGGHHYHVTFDDGDEQDHTWREIQLGLRWHQTGGFVPADHDEPLPTGAISSAGGEEWALTEEEGLEPRFPELKDHYESTDGAGGQFQGETNYGEIGRGAAGPSKVRRHGIIDEKNHGKNVSDPAGGQFQARLNESVASNHEVFPGTRNCVLYMAQYHPMPAASEQKKPTTWSPDTKVYAFYSPKVLTKKKKQHFKPYKDSKQYHSRHGMCTNYSRAESRGPLIVSEGFCACSKCLEFKFSECLVKEHVGRVKTVEVPRKKGEKTAVTQSVALPIFAAGVEKGATWAVNAAEQERAAEGRYWLAQIQEAPHQNPQEFMHCGERFEKDYYIAEIRWLRCVRRGVVRSYKVEKERSYLNVNAIIRTDGPVQLTKPRGGVRKGELDLSSEEQTRVFNAA